MDDSELITYNGKKYKFRDLPPEIQEVLKDDNNNGIPDRLEPQVNAATTKEKNQHEHLTTQETSKKPVKVQGVRLSITKKYLSTSTFYFVVTFAAGIVIFILFYFAGVLTG
jgi:hypothetical protein